MDLPALAPVFPTSTGTCVILDIGANPDCKAENLYQFAIMGSIYTEKVRGVKNPRIGLISNGEEEGKGNKLVHDALPLIKGAGLNFYGNVEGKEVFGGKVDVAVTDGFTGNVLLKSTEAVAKLILEKVKEYIKKGGPVAILGGMMVRPALGQLRKLLDPNEEGAAPLLGTNGIVFIGHGRSDEIAIKNAIRLAKNAADANLVDAIRDGIEQRLQKTI